MSEPVVLPPSLADLFAGARRVADAVLYEGYVLYPYRRSAPKNQVRWQFGVLVPPGAAALDPSERSRCAARLALEGDAGTTLVVLVRCLQLQQRTVQAPRGAGRFSPVEELVLASGARVLPFDEAVAQERALGPIPLGNLLEEPIRWTFQVPGGRDEELIPAGDQVAGRLVRRRWALQGRLTLRAERLGGSSGPVLLDVVVENRTRWRDVPPGPVGGGPVGGGPLVASEGLGAEPASLPGGISPRARWRDRVVRRSLLGAHLLLGLEDGAFLSSRDLPPEHQGLERRCSAEGVFPSLVGGSQRAPVVLLSPIALPEDPQVAPESPGDFFDATEIDELLALRVLTLTDEEKAEAMATDPASARILARCEGLGPPQIEALHGTVRSLRSLNQGTDRPVGGVGGEPWWDPEAEASVSPGTDVAMVGGRPTRAGDRVVLRPGRRADAQDLFLAGRSATVTGVFSDLEGRVHLAVVPDDDPGADLHRWFGRYWYFAPEELERLEPEADRLRVLVAGIGNVFLGDDGFGVAVAEELATRSWPAGVEIRDSGIRGVHLAYQLLDGWDLVVLVDALEAPDPPGTLRVVELGLPEPGAGTGVEAEEPSVLDAHGMRPEAVLAMAGRLGAQLGRVVLVGCVPEDLREGMGLSEALRAAVPEACRLVGELVDQALRDATRGPKDKKEVLR
jgi:hydrogenase maturation protease